VLLTTQYLDEADALADTISVIDRGEVIAEGTARELKARIGGEQLEVTLTAADARGPRWPPWPRWPPERSTWPTTGRRLTAPIEARGGIATAVIRALDAAGRVGRRRRGPPALARRRVLLPHRAAADRLSLPTPARPHHPVRPRARGGLTMSPPPSTGPVVDDDVVRPLPLPTGSPRDPAVRRGSEWLRDVSVLTRRNLLHVRREPAQMSDATVQPLLFTVLFVYIFGRPWCCPAAAATRTSPSVAWSR
jgi:hypothetical protein